MATESNENKFKFIWRATKLKGTEKPFSTLNCIIARKSGRFFEMQMQANALKMKNGLHTHSFASETVDSRWLMFNVLFAQRMLYILCTNTTEFSQMHAK